MKRSLLLILLALLLSAGIIYTAYQRSVQEAYLQEFRAAMEGLELERNSIEDELEDLRNRMTNVREESMGLLVFRGADLRIYEEIAPIMDSYGMVGVIVLDDVQTLNQPGQMDDMQLYELRKKGWAVGANWPNSADVGMGLDQIGEQFEASWLSKPRLLYLPQGSYDTAYDEVLMEHGCLGVIMFQEKQKADNLIDTYPAICWNDPAVLAYIEYAVNQNSVLALIVDFATVYGDYDRELFEYMCKYLSEVSESFAIVSQETACRTGMKTSAFIRARTAYLEQELVRCEREIQALYDLYDQYKGKSIFTLS